MALRDYYHTHWKDILIIASFLLLAITLILSAYNIGKSNRLAAQANSIAAQSKQHIDCIIKDLATPQAPGTQHKYISELSSQCNIKFTQ